MLEESRANEGEISTLATAWLEGDTEQLTQLTRRGILADPELAQVGLTEAQAREAHGNKASCVRFAFAENDRAVAERRTEGLIKVSVVRGKPVGATIVGPHAGDLLGVWALAIANGTKMSGIAGMVAPYPTWGEVNKRAAGAYFSPKLFDNPLVKRTVRLVQRIIP